MLLISQDYFYPLFRNEVAGIAVENPSANSGDRRPGFHPGVGKIPWRRDGNPPMVLAWRIAWTEEPGGL